MHQNHQNKRLYHIGGGVQETELFFGRERLLTSIRDNLPSNFLVLGGRMQGKTSLLKAVDRKSASWGWDCHYLQPGSDDLELRLEAILDKRENLRRSNPNTDRFNLRPPIILIDEAQILIGRNKSQREKIFHLLDTLRTRETDHQCYFVLAGDWNLIRAAEEWPFDKFRTLEIGPLSLEAAKKLISQPLKAGFQYDSDEVIGDIVEKSGKQAYLICLICNEIVQDLRSRKSNDLTIRQHDVVKALRSYAVREKFKGWRERIRGLGWQDWAIDLIENSMERDAPFDLRSILAVEGQLALKKEDVDHLLAFLRSNGWLLSTEQDKFCFLPLFKREVQRVTRSRPMKAHL